MSLLHRIAYLFWKSFRPVMVSGFKSKRGELLAKTRVSNTTYIGNKENLDLENNIYIGHYNHIDASNGVKIGEGCQLTNYISVLTHSSHIAIRLYGEKYTQEKEPIAYNRGSVELGKYCFVGPHSVIMPNTKIGKGSLISAYSYVKGDFEDFSIIAGNPAKRIGDTREMDSKYLDNNPRLKKLYNAWAK